MKAEDKALIYDLLKKASASILGYTAREFEGDVCFSDDVVFPSGAPSSDNLSSQNQVENHAQSQGGLILVICEVPSLSQENQTVESIKNANELLIKMLGAIHLEQDKNCSILNISEINFDSFQLQLKEKINTIQPKAILAMGLLSLKVLLNSNDFETMRGNFSAYNNIPVMTTYNPATLLTTPNLKRSAWEDLKKFVGMAM